MLMPTAEAVNATTENENVEVAPENATNDNPEGLNPLQLAQKELDDSIEKEEATEKGEPDPEANVPDEGTPDADSGEPDPNADDNKELPDKDNSTDEGQTGDDADPDKSQTDKPLEERFTALEQEYKSREGRLEKLGEENARLKENYAPFMKFESILATNPELGRIFADVVFNDKIPQANQTGTPAVDANDYDPNDLASMEKLIDARANALADKREKDTRIQADNASNMRIRNNFVANSNTVTQKLIKDGIPETEIASATTKFMQDIATKLPEMAVNHAKFDTILETEKQKSYEEGKKDTLANLKKATNQPPTLSSVKTSRASTTSSNYKNMSFAQLSTKLTNMNPNDPEFKTVEAQWKAKMTSDENPTRDLGSGKKTAG